MFRSGAFVRVKDNVSGLKSWYGLCI